MTLAELEEISRRDKRRMIIMGVGAVLLVGTYLGTQLVGSQYEQAEQVTMPAEPAAPDTSSQTAALPFDQYELLEGIRDASAEERLTTKDEALTAVLYYSKLLSALTYQGLGIEDLNGEVIASLSDNPSGHRLKALRARGTLEQLGKRQREGVVFEEYFGIVRLDDGGSAHIAFTSPPEDGIEVGSPVALSGLFVQMFSSELRGEWVDAPLLASRVLQPSSSLIGRQDPADLRALLLQEIQDDELDNIAGVPEHALWRMMAFARDQADEVDWSAAEELDSEVLEYLVRDGSAFRGVPYRVPISGNMGTWSEVAEENGLRLPRVSKGWIGNFAWRGPTGVINWVGPFEKPELSDREGAARLVTARGFFFKNLFYEQRDGNPGRAPLFVMAEVEPFTPPVDSSPVQLVYFLVGTTLTLILLIFFLLRRDRRSSDQLRQNLARRRRMRKVDPGTTAEDSAGS